MRSEDLVRPLGVAEVGALAGKALRMRALENEVTALRREGVRGAAPGERLVGKSSEMLEIFKTVGRVAARDVSILITGESGVGKEVVAYYIHQASQRAGSCRTAPEYSADQAGQDLGDTGKCDQPDRGQRVRAARQAKIEIPKQQQSCDAETTA